MSKNWALFRRFDIADEKTGEVYLRRWYLVATPWFSVLLHQIRTPDKDRDLHDHPWSFVSLVLWGGYDELIRPGADWPGSEWSQYGVRRGRLSIAYRGATCAHRIVSLHRSPTWTLVLTGRRRREWGFYTRSGWVDWRTYLGLAAAMLVLLSSCCGPRPSEASTWSLIAPEYVRYVEADPNLTRDQKDDRLLTVETWRVRAGAK